MFIFLLSGLLTLFSSSAYFCEALWSTRCFKCAIEINLTWLDSNSAMKHLQYINLKETGGALSDITYTGMVSTFYCVSYFHLKFIKC